MQENAVAPPFKRGYTRKAQAEFQCVYTFKEIRNYQAQQQAIFLALLNRVYDVHVQQQVKRSLVTLPFFRVEELRSDTDVIRVNDFVETRCRERYAFETRQGVSEKTARATTSCVAYDACVARWTASIVSNIASICVWNAATSVETVSCAVRARCAVWLMTGRISLMVFV